MFGPKSKKPAPAMMTAITNNVTTEPAPQNEETVMPVSTAQNIIGKGTVIEGNIVAEGDLCIEGTVRGNVTTKTNLIIGPSCIIEGHILAEHAEVAGQVKGTVQALGLLIIKSSSMIDGDVLTKNLNVESGSTFNGRFTVGSVTSTSGVKKTEAPTVKADLSILGNDVRRTAIAPGSPTKV
jgi:cytoskeletal protein CcmA (bactofilin family)